MLKSEEREKTTAKTTEIQEDEDDEENQLNATHRELREAENSIHRAVIDAARRTDRLERIERKSARLRGSAERFRENTRLLRQGVLERRRWHLFWAFLLCFNASLIFIALISWIIVAYTGAWDIERERRNKRGGCSTYLKLFGNRKRRKMERDEATQTTEDDGRAIPLSQRVYRYVFVRDNSPTWIETSNGWLSGWWFILLSFAFFYLFWKLLGQNPHKVSIALSQNWMGKQTQGITSKPSESSCEDARVAALRCAFSVEVPLLSFFSLSLPLSLYRE